MGGGGVGAGGGNENRTRFIPSELRDAFIQLNWSLGKQGNRGNCRIIIDRQGGAPNQSFRAMAPPLLFLYAIDILQQRQRHSRVTNVEEVRNCFTLSGFGDNKVSEMSSRLFLLEKRPALCVLGSFRAGEKNLLQNRNCEYCNERKREMFWRYDYFGCFFSSAQTNGNNEDVSLFIRIV